MRQTTIVYTKPECVQCKYTIKMLEEHHVPYETRDVTKDTQARAAVEATGRTEMPMVVHGEDVWHGFRPEKLKDLVSSVGS